MISTSLSVITSTRSAATPGIATTTTISRSVSYMSTGGSHDARDGRDVSRRKKRRWSRSAWSRRSQASAHIQSPGSDLRMRRYPLEELRKRQRARLARDLAAVAKRDQCRDAADGVMRRDLGLCFGVELGEANAGRDACRGLLVGGRHHP